MANKKESLVFCYWDDVWDIPTHLSDREDVVNLILEEDENKYTSSIDSERGLLRHSKVNVNSSSL